MCRCRCRSQTGRLFPSRNKLLFGVLCCAVLCLLTGRYGESGNESERVWRTRRRMSSPSQSRSDESFFLSLPLSLGLLRVRPVQFLALFHRTFCLALFSLGKAQSRSMSRTGALCLLRLSPSWFFLVAFVTAAIPAARAHRRCCPPRGVCASAFVLITAVISGWAHSSKCVQCSQCYQWPATVGRLGRPGYCPLSKLSLDGSPP